MATHNAGVKAMGMGALIAEGEISAIKSGRGKLKAAGKKTVGAGKRGSIVISKDIVGSLGIGSGDKFVLRKTKAGIALKKS